MSFSWNTNSLCLKKEKRGSGRRIDSVPDRQFAQVFQIIKFSSLLKAYPLLAGDSVIQGLLLD